MARARAQPACVSYVIGDAIFCGDTIFMHDAGTARCDFPGGSAHTLWGSVEKLLSLPEDQLRFSFSLCFFFTLLFLLLHLSSFSAAP